MFPPAADNAPPDAPPTPRVWLRIYAGSADALLARIAARRFPPGDPLAGLGVWIHARWAMPHAPSKHTINLTLQALHRANDLGVPAIPGAVLDPNHWNDRRAWDARLRWLERLAPAVEKCNSLALDLEQYPPHEEEFRPRPGKPPNREQVMDLNEALEPLAAWLADIKDLICYPATHRGGGIYTAAAHALGADTLADERTFELCRAIKRDELTAGEQAPQRATEWRAYFRAADQFAAAGQKRYLPGIISSILKPGRRDNLATFNDLLGTKDDLWALLDDEATFFTPLWFTEQKRRPPAPRPKRR